MIGIVFASKTQNIMPFKLIQSCSHINLTHRKNAAALMGRDGMKKGKETR
jgi:hypothetical protein